MTHHLLTAAVLDRLSLTPWADVQLRSLPETIMRRTRLAAAAVHQPDLLILDSLLDDLDPAEAAALAADIRDLGRDTAVVATGSDAGRWPWPATRCSPWPTGSSSGPELSGGLAWPGLADLGWLDLGRPELA